MTCIPGEDVGNLSLILEHVSLLITNMFHLQIINHARVTFQKNPSLPSRKCEIVFVTIQTFLSASPVEWYFCLCLFPPHGTSLDKYLVLFSVCAFFRIGGSKDRKTIFINILPDRLGNVHPQCIHARCLV